MNKLSGAVLALAVLLSGVFVSCGYEGSIQAPHEAPKSVYTPTASPTPTLSVFQQHLAKLNPSLQKYVKGLYKEYSQNSWKYQGWDKLHKYIAKSHTSAERQFKFPEPVSHQDISEIVYGLKVYSKKWHADLDWMVAFTKHESGFLDIIGDKKDKVTKKPNPPEKLSLGLDQVQLGTARGNLSSRGIDPTGLTTDDLLYFRLMNLDIGISVMSSKIRQRGRKNGTKAYNGGDGGWRDGRADKYYKDVLHVYNNRKAWTTAK